MWKGGAQHIMLSRDHEGWKMPDNTFPSVPALIDYYQSKKKPLNKTGVKLLNLVKRKNWLVHSKDVELTKKIGEGNFGEVWLGKLRFGKVWIPVAVKTCKALVGAEQREDFMREAKIMLNYRNDNVVRLYAVAADKPPLMLIMEHCPGGGLNTNLQKNAGSVSVKEKVRLCMEAARGMEYLAVKKNCVHRDLAARNCLLGVNNVLKIADFGMTRQGTYKLTEDSNVRTVPIRWTAPETLASGVFTKESDVWSFGILMWEIFQDGQEPWPGKDLKQVYRSARAGEKNLTPVGTPDLVEKLMSMCWDLVPESRPDMTQVRARLEGIAINY